MIYKAIGLMSGSSLDGLDIVYAHFQETGGAWSYEIINAECYVYPQEWIEQLRQATSLPARDYQLLHASYGQYTGEQVNRFIQAFSLQHKVDFIASHGHTTFHDPVRKMTAQLGDGAAIAAATRLPVISDLRAMDIALGGQGAPIVPIGEKLLLNDFDLLLNLGGIANVSAKTSGGYIAFDICPANRILNMLAAREGKAYDEDGKMAAAGKLHSPLLHALNQLGYYGKGYPKSLANDFGTDQVFPIIQQYNLPVADALHTYVAHICMQVKKSIEQVMGTVTLQPARDNNYRLLATGGGALNAYLVNEISSQLADLKIETIVPDGNTVNFKEALIMALIGVLRWREEYNVLSGVTGAARDSIGGALWLGVEA